MLRPIRSTQSSPRMIISSFTGAAGGATLLNGDNAYSVARSTQGVYAVTFRRPFTVGCAVACNSANAGYSVSCTSNSNTGFTLTNYNETTATDGVVHFMALGFDSIHKEIVPAQTIVSALPKPRFFPVQVNTSGAITVGAYDASVASGGTGVYNLTFKKAFGRVPVVVANATTAGYNCAITACTRTGCAITVSDTAQTPTGSIGFIAFIAGTDGLEPGDGVSRIPLACSQLKPYIVGAYISAKSGTTITKSFGASHATMSSSGADALSVISFDDPGNRVANPTDLTSSNWTKNNGVTVAGTGPSVLTAPGTSAVHSVNQSLHTISAAATIPAGRAGKMIFDVAYNTYQYVWLGHRGDSADHGVSVDLLNGTLGTATNCTASIETTNASLRRYRVTITFTNTNASLIPTITFGTAGNGSTTTTTADKISIYSVLAALTATAEPLSPTDTKRNVLAVASGGSVAKGGCGITLQSNFGFSISPVNEAGTVKDDAFSFIALGFGAATEV